MSTINFSQLKEKASEGFPTLDEGNYQLEVKEAEFQTSKAGNPMIVLQLEEPDTKIKVREFLALTEKAAFKVLQFLKNAGINPPEGNIDVESDTFEDFVDSLVGAEVNAHVTIREYTNQEGNKQKSNNIKSYVDKSKVGKGARKKSRTL